jgi:hypothetical protein
VKREYLSSEFVIPMKVISVIMLMPIAILEIPEIMLGDYETIPILVFLTAIFAISWIQDVVYIENGELVVDRIYRTIRLKPEEIEDLNYIGITGLLKLSFRHKTRFGGWVAFGARSKRIFGHPDLYDDIPTIERIGLFCGWKKAK